MRLTPEAQRAVDFCTYCPRLCHFACPAAHGDASEASTAWGLMSLVHAVQRGRVALDSSIAERWYRCASCDRCQSFCKHGNDVAGAMGSVRAQLFDAGEAPARFKELAQTLREEARRQSATEASPAVTARVGLLLGCETRAAWGAERSERFRVMLEAWLGEPVSDVSGAVHCCGAVSERAGDVAEAERARHEGRHALRHVEVLLSDCDGSAKLATEGGPTQIVPLTRALASAVPDTLRSAAARRRSQPLTVHGACGDRRRWDTRADEQTLLHALGAAPEPAWAIEGEQECCGGERVYRTASPDGAARAAEALRSGAQVDASAPLISSRVSCAAHLSTPDQQVPSLLDWVMERAEELAK